jgi:hypothetical protein
LFLPVDLVPGESAASVPHFCAWRRAGN